MKNKSIIPAFIVILFILKISLIAQVPSIQKVSEKNEPFEFIEISDNSTSGSKEILYEQIGNPSNEDGVLSQESFDNPDYICQATDDFIVPMGEEWIIENIQVEGMLIGPGPLDLVNIFIYMDAGDMPGPEIYFEIGLPVPPDPSGNLDIFLPGMPILNEGKYWLSVQAMMPINPSGEWLWQKQESPTMNSELLWQNPGGGLGGPPFWEPGSFIWGGMGYEDWDLSFTLFGLKMLFNPPVIAEAFPEETYPGDLIYLYGEKFGDFTPASLIEIDGGAYYFDSCYWDSSLIIFELPYIIANDSISVSVITESGISEPSFIDFFYPSEAYIFEPVEDEIVFWDTLNIIVAPESHMELIDSAYFYYRITGQQDWIFIGSDTCGESLMVGTTSPSGEGEGWDYDWDVGWILEDSVEIRVDLFDQYGQILTGETKFLVDKSPTIPFIDLESSKLATGLALENDSLVLNFQIQDNIVDSVKVNLQAIDWNVARGVIKIHQNNVSVVDEKKRSLALDACGPTAAASCLKWLANKHHPGSKLDKKDSIKVANKLTRKAKTTHEKGAAPSDVKKAMKKVYKKGTKSKLDIGYVHTYKTKSRGKGLDFMIKEYKANKDVVIRLKQKVKNSSKHFYHYVTMNSLHTDKKVYKKDKDGNKVEVDGIEVDFMDPATGEITTKVMTKDVPPQLLDYTMSDDPPTEGNATVNYIISAKPKGSKVSIEDSTGYSHLTTIDVNGMGDYSYKIASKDLPEGSLLFEFATVIPGGTGGYDVVWCVNGPYTPLSNYTSDISAGTNPLTVNFTDISTPADSLISWEWDFGDGNTSNLINPTHTYTSNGIYDVSLIVSDGILYDTITIPDYIKVGTLLDMKAYLEGPFSGSFMNADLNPDSIPLAQPYNISPWLYSGTEMVDSIPNDSIVDWILVELRETPYAADSAGGSSVIARQAAFILRNGNIVGPDGRSPLYFDLEISDNLYVVIWHRNHLGIMSANALSLSNSIYTYDFTSGSSQIYGGINGAKELTTGIWGMVAGDGNSDGEINNTDKNDVFLPQNGDTGYLNADLNIDADVNNVDLENYWAPNSGNGSQIPGDIPQGGYKSMVPE